MEEVGEISYADVTAEVDESLMEEDESDDDSESQSGRSNSVDMMRS